jgi:hypothetical protein
MRLSIPSLYAVVKVAVEAPSWWDGHIIRYKEYPDGLGNPAATTLNLSSPDAAEQSRPPASPGDVVEVELPGGRIIEARVESVDISRPGWPEDFDPHSGDEESIPMWHIGVFMPPKEPLGPATRPPLAGSAEADTPITREWLLSMGLKAVPSPMGPRFSDHLEKGKLNVWEWGQGEWLYTDADSISMRTRGELRLLARLLKVPLSFNPDTP